MDGKENQMLTEQIEGNTKTRSEGNQNSEIIKEMAIAKATEECEKYRTQQNLGRVIN